METVRRPTLWVVIHWVIIVNFLLEIGYAAYQVFYVHSTGSAGPLWGGAVIVAPEKMLARRLYAIEAWLAIGGLSIYLAITEIGPRFWRR